MLTAHTDDENIFQNSREGPLATGFISALATGKLRSKPLPHHLSNGPTFRYDAACGQPSCQVHLIFYPYLPITQIFPLFSPVLFHAPLPHILGGMRRGINNKSEMGQKTGP